MTYQEELAAGAEVPERWRDLMRHVAENMEAHGLGRLAHAYRGMADAADEAARTMRAPDNPAPADPGDLAALARWMEKKIAMQRELAALLTRHADESEVVLARLRSS